MPVVLSSQSFDSNFNLVDPRVRQGKTIILVYRTGCGWCEDYHPRFKEAESLNRQGGDPSIHFAELNTADNPNFISEVQSMAGNIGFQIKGVPTILGYANGQFYSMYEDSKEPGKTYRSVEDTLEYVNGIGHADITYI
jgi:thiol-disulfide isomerase/thioredoxin